MASTNTYAIFLDFFFNVSEAPITGNTPKYDKSPQYSVSFIPVYRRGWAFFAVLKIILSGCINTGVYRDNVILYHPSLVGTPKNLVLMW